MHSCFLQADVVEAALFMEHMHHTHTLIATAGIAGYFFLGLVGSLHCIGMCGPLSILFCDVKQSGESTNKVARINTLNKNLLFYHLGRLISYSLLGALIFKIGSRIDMMVMIPFSLILMVTCLLLYAVGISLAPPKILLPIQHAWMRLAKKRVPIVKALYVGLFTPLLPCGLLYGVLMGATQASNALYASAMMAAFMLGTLPGLLFFQYGLQKIASWKGGVFRVVLSRFCALIAALVAIYMYFVMH